MTCGNVMMKIVITKLNDLSLLFVCFHSSISTSASWLFHEKQRYRSA